MDSKTAMATIQLLQRTQLTGNEVPIYMGILQALNAIIKNEVKMVVKKPKELDLPVTRMPPKK